MTVCLAGKHSLAVQCATFFLKNHHGHKLIACINRDDHGINEWQPSFAFFCEQNNITIVPLQLLYDIDDLIFVSLEFDRLLKPAKFRTKNLFNIHFSKLPAYKGAYTAIHPLLNGEVESGVTLHKIDHGIDTGDIIDQVCFPLGTDMTALQLFECNIRNGVSLFKNNIQSLLDGTFHATAQRAERSSYFSRQSIDFNRIQIDINQAAFQIHNQVRAYTFRPYQLPVFRDQKIYKSEIIIERSTSKPDIIEQDEWVIVCNTIDFRIKLYIDKLDHLMDAAKGGNIKKYGLLKKNNFPCDTRSPDGCNAMIIATRLGNFEFVKYLHADGAEINVADNAGKSLLMYALDLAYKENRTDIFDFLCTCNIDIDHQDLYGKDVLHYANAYGDNNLVRKLMK